MSKQLSLISAFVCCLIWGTTFIAQDTGMDDIGPFTFNASRFFVAFFVIVPFVLIFEKEKILKYVKPKKADFIRLMIPVGLSLFFGSQLQQVSLIYTDVANSAFFTIFKAKESSERVIFHFTELSLNLCLVISNKPKLLILPI